MSAKISLSDALPFLDPSPEFEGGILSRATKQIEDNKTLEKVSGLMESLSEHFMSIQNEVTQLSSLLDTLNMDMPFISVLQSFSQMFSTWGRQFVSQSNLSMQIIRTVIIPSITKLYADYNEVNSHYSKVIESYSSLDRKAKQEDQMQIEASLQKAATLRSGTLFSLENQISLCEKTAVKSVSVAIAQFISLTANLMKTYVQNNSIVFDLADNTVPDLQSAVKHNLSKNINPQPDNNPVTAAANIYWDMRLTEHSETPEELAKASGTVWVRDSHTMRPTWSKKYLTFKDSVLVATKTQAEEQDKQWVLPLITVAPVEIAPAFGSMEKCRRFTFKIQSPQELIEIQALSKFDLDEWITIFTNHNFKMLGQEENTSSHKKCADCGAPDATWVSVNWACDLCLKCSGVHRAMSSTNSKVRSITLDKLKPIVVQMLNELSGDCNQLLLSQPHKEKIDSRTDEKIRTTYITRKYVNFEWAPTGSIPDPFQAILKHDIHGLFYAAHFGRIEDVDDSLTPFHAACSIGDPLAVSLLAYCVKNLNVRDRNGWTPLCYAVFFQHVEIIEFLLSFGASAKDVGINLYQLAIATKNVKVAKMILVAANSVRNDENVFQPVSYKYAPPGTPPGYKLMLKPTVS